MPTYQRTCDQCGGPFQTDKKRQQYCSVPCRAAGQGERRRSGPATRDSLAGSLVREWSPARRARIRAELLRWIEAADTVAWPEMQLVALIDKISEEEAA